MDPDVVEIPPPIHQYPPRAKKHKKQVSNIFFLFLSQFFMSLCFALFCLVFCSFSLMGCLESIQSFDFY